MATRSSILAWRIPWREEPGRLQFMGSQRVGHDQSSHNIPLSQSLSQSKPFTCFSSLREVAEEMFEIRRDLFLRLKERSHFCKVKLQGEAASASTEAAGNYTGSLV